MTLSDDENSEEDFKSEGVSDEEREKVLFVDINDSESSQVVTDGQLKRKPKYTTTKTGENEEENQQEEATVGPNILQPESIQNEVEEATLEQQSVIKLINRRPLSKTAATYELEKFEKKALVIFNQEEIYGYEKRLGSKKDVKALTKSFKPHGFEVKEHKDLVRKDLFSELDKFFSQDFSDYGCIAIAILTHGSYEGKLYAKDVYFYESEIIKYFKSNYNPSMLTKPKILIIQACRGKGSRVGMTIGRVGQVKLDQEEEIKPYTLPIQSDVVVLHSSYMGKPSHRDTIHGSWLIQTLCAKINKMAKTDNFISILGDVLNAVAIDMQVVERNRGTYEIDTNKQMPIISSTLIRKLYLKKFEGTTSSAVESSMDVTPVASLLDQFDPCLCYLDYFEYMKNCLRLMVKEYPDDTNGHDLLTLADTFDGDHFNSSKERLSRVIRNHIEKNAKDRYWYKYAYIKHPSCCLRLHNMRMGEEEGQQS